MPLAEHEEMILTDAQYQAFQEAFELFDKNGGGTIDAAELQKTLDDCGIYVNGDDLGMKVPGCIDRPVDLYWSVESRNNIIF